MFCSDLDNRGGVGSVLGFPTTTRRRGGDVLVGGVGWYGVGGDFPGGDLVAHDSVEVSIFDVRWQEVHRPRVDAEDVDPGDGCEVALWSPFSHAVDGADAGDDGVDLVVHHRRDEHEGRDGDGEEGDDHAARRRRPVGDALLEVVDDQRQAVDALDDGVEEEEHEVLLVVGADAVVHPRAVVVHADDTSIADAAVVAPGRLVGVAAAADRLGDARLARPDQGLGVARHRSRIREHRLELRHERHERDQKIHRHVVDAPAPDQRHVEHHDIRVQRQHPQQRRHHRPGVVTLIEPVPGALVRPAHRGIELVHRKSAFTSSTKEQREGRRGPSRLS
mmetsp:Transcript_26173/g.84717  ORF Transcript_26173/g.84717 Transcript_26173/m.84717 type:complete len:333 (-) Transcript_26173:38-1036(-)